MERDFNKYMVLSMSALEEFRQATRQWLEQNCPPEMRVPIQDQSEHCWGGRQWQFESDAQKVWLERMADKGWTAPQWAPEYGGAGLSQAEADILKEEMARISAREPVSNFGFWMLGPALLKFGSEELKRTHLPLITDGSIRWCQGYSEPNAGSDLASLQTSAEDKGDHFLVNGQKIWTSYANKADWIFCLVRTDPNATKHNGISFLLFDMDSPGVTTRPIELISGESPFCEVFFDNVKVPKDNLVGDLHRGWDIAKYLLTHERDKIGGEPPGILRGQALGQLAREYQGCDADQQLTDPVLRAQISELEIDSLAFNAWTKALRQQAEDGQGIGATSSLLKYVGTELNKKRYELMMDAMGSTALEWQSERTRNGMYASEWLRSKGNSIEGGTSEVMLGIAAKRLLDLPSQ